MMSPVEEHTALQGTVLVVRGESVLYEASRGFADRESGTPCTPRTRFQIASVSKQFTVAAILSLVDDGKLALDDQVGRWIDGCPPSWQEITVHHLLTHTSGLGHWEDFPALTGLTASPPADEVVKAFQQSDPLFPVGTDWAYSSPGYVLLAHIVVRASGEPYLDFLTRTVLEPLDLRDTFAGAPDGRTGVAIGYAGAEAVESFELASVWTGTGDVWSTTGDLLRWDQALAAGEILSDESRRLMFTPHASTNGKRQFEAYGYGWMFGRIAGRPVRCHSGDNPGFRAFNAWFPELSAYVIVLSNDDAADAYALTVQLAEAQLASS
jgi:CubicO group peptidase (beta-lactamase class C family)